MIALFIVLAISYVLGSIPSSLWVGQIFHKMDIRKFGSGNLGTTNAFRNLGWKSGISVLVLDFMKGFVASYWVALYAFEIGNGPIAPPGWEADAFLKITCGLMAVVGHMFPIFANFKGGKGAATACGMLYGIEPISIGISSVIFIAIVLDNTVRFSGFHDIKFYISDHFTGHAFWFGNKCGRKYYNFCDLNCSGYHL
ncbi:MAG: glycerol-3-phosphate acyltransferase [Gracilimonas sp.]|nr:glycerol-3-phosphate acyltransferase [Gracilimonas sp.]